MDQRDRSSCRLPAETPRPILSAPCLLVMLRKRLGHRFRISRQQPSLHPLEPSRRAPRPIAPQLSRPARHHPRMPSEVSFVPTFPQCSPPSLLTTAACGGLRSTPDCRPRRTSLHLSYSYAPPCGPAQDPNRTYFPPRAWPTRI